MRFGRLPKKSKGIGKTKERTNITKQPNKAKQIKQRGQPMVTDYQQQFTETLQQAWTDLRKEIILIEDIKVKDKLLFKVNQCIDWAPLLYLVPMQDAFAEILIDLAPFAWFHVALLEKIRQVKRLLEELKFSFNL